MDPDLAGLVQGLRTDLKCVPIEPDAVAIGGLEGAHRDDLSDGAILDPLPVHL